MTTTVTKREIGLEIGNRPRGASGGSNAAASTRAPARACARLTVTERIGKTFGLISFLASSGGLSARRWWAFTARPLSLRALWRVSAVDPRRVPASSGTWTALWRWSNRTDRLSMFALIFLAPTGLTGPLRWITARPTRRIAFYLLTALFVAYVLI